MKRPKINTPIKSIRLRCLDCCAQNQHEVRLCESADCPLFPYRFGRRPSPEVKKEIFEAVPYRSLPSGEIKWEIKRLSKDKNKEAKPKE